VILAVDGARGGWRIGRAVGEWQAVLLKRDVFGCVERLDGPGAALVRRVARGGRVPLAGLVARLLLRRERRALLALEGLEGVPQAVEEAAAARAPSALGWPLRPERVLVRSWLAGEPLHRARALPTDFFEHLDELVVALHARGVCHNDLHKEQNIVVGTDGRPHLIDFQLASVHRRRGRAFRRRTQDDLRHVHKHRMRYTLYGRGPGGKGLEGGLGAGLRRRGLARVWRRLGKPLYEGFTRGLLGTRDGEERRPSSGPWPRWTQPLGPGRRAPRGEP
jgi:hypothetical protein